jgi:hypothetical protein
VFQTIQVQPLAKRCEEMEKQYKDEPLRLAGWMLQNWNLTPDDRTFDMRKKFEALIDKLAELAPKLNARDQARVQALVATRDALKNDLPDAQDEIARLREVLPDGEEYRVLSRGHYALLHRGRDDRGAEDRHQRLERAYAGFFYWFALQGKVLPVPEKKLVCVLADNTASFKQLHTMFDSLPMAADGFYSSLDNVVILSPGRTDSLFEQFQSHASEVDKQLGLLSQSLNQQFSKQLGEIDLSLAKVIRGDPLPPRYQQLRQQIPPQITAQIAYGQVLALALHAAQAEGEVAAISHEAVQQLAVATRLWPRRVKLPRAIQFGMGSFFETPKSHSEYDLPSPWTGIGAPHWVYLPLFRELLKNKGGTLILDKGTPDEQKIEVGSLSILPILTDQNFAAAEEADDKVKSLARDKARAEAWALMYFLAREEFPRLLKFFEELSRMPRDMELTPEIIEHAFAKAFDLQDKKNPDRIDPAKLAELESRWHNFMAVQVLPVTLPRAPDEKPAKPNPPAGGGGRLF